MKSANCYRVMCFVLLFTLVAACYVCATCYAQTFDESVYHELAEASSSEAIPPGTVISIANWRKYRNLMHVGLQALFAGKYTFHLGTGPEYTIKVNPTSDIKLPAAFLRDTEKFGGQARLKQNSEGGYIFEGYSAGLMFPNPAEPQMGVKVLYNAWAPPSPALVFYWFDGGFVDRYANFSRFLGITGRYTLSFLSDPPYPREFPFAGTYFKSLLSRSDLPEQTKYTTALDLIGKDPERPGELYVFLPSLRRSLRLSQAARCAPILGTDWTNDDNGGVSFLVGQFNVKEIGEKKILASVNVDYQHSAKGGKTYVLTNPLPGWPLSDVAHWELRDVHVIDVTPINQPGYCYSHRVMYIDAKLWNEVAYDLYDHQGKLWKTSWSGFFPFPTHGENVVNPYMLSATIWDVQNSHTSFGYDVPPWGVDETVPKEWQDVQTVAFPGGLANIMK
jgi:hypothetical protein